MKKLSVFALVATLLTGACGLGGVSGTINYDEVTVNLTSTLYVSRDVVAGAALEGEDDFNTSCSNPFDAVGEETDVAGILTALVLVAYEEDFGVVHLCAGTYETDEIIQFPNLGSITIEGDGMNETIIRGIDADHALLAMVPADCLPQEPEDLCPSYFNVLTLKDLTLADGVGDTDGFVLEDFVLEDEDEEASDVLFSTGGAVTAPRVATERVRFSNNSAPCGGAISLYGWTQLITENIGEGESDEVEYLSSLILPGTSQIIDTEFIENSAAIGGAIGGAYFDGEEVGEGIGEGLYGCVNAGPLNIVNSTFEGNSTNLDSVSGVSVGGAIATASLIFLFLELGGGAGDEEDVVELFNQDVWLSISSSTFTDNYAAAAGGAVFSYAKTSISRTTFTNNGVDSLDEDSTGGAIVVAGELSLSYSKLVGNSASSGGAVALIDFGGGYVFTRNTFTSNVATDQGGAIAGWTDAGSARGNRFTSNRAPVGSAVAVQTERCSRTWSRRAARDWRGNTFRQNRGGRLPVECYVGGQG
jgi:predicted outer membrane repeat protein